MNHFGKVAVLMGGLRRARDLAPVRQGGAGRAASRGVDAHAFDPAERRCWTLKDEGFDRVFIALHGRFGEDGTVQGALELLGIPYTGSGVMASALAMDKWRTKMVWVANGCRRRAGTVLGPTATGMRAAELGLPLIVKPAREGSSVGLTKVTRAPTCADAYAAAVQARPAGARRGVRRRQELTAAFLGDRGAAAGAHRGAGRQLRLPEQVLHRRHEVLLPERPARAAEETIRDLVLAPRPRSAAAAGAAPT
jgi:D-alanine-D-alanine ligase